MGLQCLGIEHDHLVRACERWDKDESDVVYELGSISVLVADDVEVRCGTDHKCIGGFEWVAPQRVWRRRRDV